MLGLGINILENNIGIFNVSETLLIPTNINAIEDTPGGDITVTWDASTSSGVTNYKIYREIITDSSRTLLDTVSSGTLTYTDTTTVIGLEHIYDIQTVKGIDETTDLTYGVNTISITSTPSIVQPAIYLNDTYTERLYYSSNKTYSGAFNIKIGIQDWTDSSGSMGLVGSLSGTSQRILISPSLNNVRANIATGLLTSPALSPAFESNSKKILEIYRDGANDIYMVDGVNPAQFLFNASPNFVVNSYGNVGGFGTTGYIWYIHDGDDEFLFEDVSGPVVTSVSGLTELNIYSTQNQAHIDANMWVTDLPLAGGSTEVQNLGVSGDFSSEVLARMDTVGGVNSWNHSHLVFMVGTNDIGNLIFVSTTEYQQNCEDIIQSALDAGSVPVFCTIGTLDDAIKKSQKNYEPQYGDESTWNFNELVDGAPGTAIIPNYMVALTTACSNKGIAAPVDIFGLFIANGTSPDYGEWIGADGTHWTATGYQQAGDLIATYLKTLSGITSIGAVGDSLMYGGLATQISNYYNS